LFDKWKKLLISRNIVPESSIKMCSFYNVTLHDSSNYTDSSCTELKYAVQPFIWKPVKGRKLGLK